MDRVQLMQLCDLARLSLSEAELDAFEGKFNRMLGFIEKVLAYEPQTEGAPLTLIEKLEPRRDVPADFEWPEGSKHEYRVPMVIDFEAGGAD